MQPFEPLEHATALRDGKQRKQAGKHPEGLPFCYYSYNYRSTITSHLGHSCLSLWPAANCTQMLTLLSTTIDHIRAAHTCLRQYAKEPLQGPGLGTFGAKR